MTQLLISAKNAIEATLLAKLGVNIVDLKDPEVGALGALDLPTTREIMRAVSDKVCVSATVGEDFTDLASLQEAIESRTALGVDIVKMVVSESTLNAKLIQLIQSLAKQNIKLVAVLFADEPINLELLKEIKRAGFFGAMLDTKNKKCSLINVSSEAFLKQFVSTCDSLKLVSGLAGSLKPQYVDFLNPLSPTYIGFRGGVCANLERKSTISEFEVVRLMEMLPNHNKISLKSL